MAEGVCGGAEAGAVSQRGGETCAEELILAINSGIKAESGERHTACTGEHERCAPAESNETEGQVIMFFSATGLVKPYPIPL